MADLLADFSPEVLKVPLGFIRCVEIPMAIVALACVAGYGQTVKYTVNCSATNKPEVTIAWDFPFRLDQVKVPSDACTATELTTKSAYAFHQEYSGTASFFVAVTVFSLIYASAALAFYLLALSLYENDSRIPRADCVATAVFGLLWLLATILWWAANAGIQIQTRPETLFQSMGDAACKAAGKCTLTPATWGYSSLTVASLAAFACTVLFVANVWFTFKETVWFHERRLPQLPVFPVGSRPAANTGAGSSTASGAGPLSGSEVSPQRGAGYEAM